MKKFILSLVFVLAYFALVDAYTHADYQLEIRVGLKGDEPQEILVVYFQDQMRCRISGKYYSTVLPWNVNQSVRVCNTNQYEITVQQNRLMYRKF